VKCGKDVMGRVCVVGWLVLLACFGCRAASIEDGGGATSRAVSGQDAGRGAVPPPKVLEWDALRGDEVEEVPGAEEFLPPEDHSRRAEYLRSVFLTLRNEKGVVCPAVACLDWRVHSCHATFTSIGLADGGVVLQDGRNNPCRLSDGTT